MSFEILEPVHTLTLDVFPQLAWALAILGSLTVVLLARAVLDFVF